MSDYPKMLYRDCEKDEVSQVNNKNVRCKIVVSKSEEKRLLKLGFRTELDTLKVKAKRLIGVK